MALCVCMGAMLQCSFGMARSSLVVLPANRSFIGAMPAANIMDNIPMVNTPPFGLCSSLANPAVAAATAAALGVLLPVPCVPVPAGPWVTGSPTALLGNMPLLNSDSRLFCAWGGVVQVAVPGQVTVMTA
ncbi:MAG: DUF4280 domain-containing protein [Noviherbaspirillum sp.]